MAKKNDYIRVVTAEEIVGKDWKYKDRIYRFYPSGQLLVKSPERQSIFTWYLSELDWMYLFIDNEKFVVSYHPNNEHLLHLTRFKPRGKLHELRYYNEQKLTTEELEDVFKLLT